MAIPTLVACDVPKKRRSRASRNSPGERHHLSFLDARRLRFPAGWWTVSGSWCS